MSRKPIELVDGPELLKRVVRPTSAQRTGRDRPRLPDPFT